MSPKILVVGCGITGAAVNRYITSMFPTLKPSYTFWEKSSSMGGRMITNFQSPPEERRDDKKKGYIPHCDMGAQYLTRSSEHSEELVYSLLSNAGVIVPMVDNTVIEGMRPEHIIKTHYIAPNGFSSVVDYLSRGNDGSKENEFSYDTTLESIYIKYCEKTQKNVFTATGSKVLTYAPIDETFDTIILTLPTPQLLELKGDIQGMYGADFVKQLSNVKYSSRFAVAFYYPKDAWPALKNVPWGGKYVFDDDIIRYVSIDNRKNGFIRDASKGGKGGKIVDVNVDLKGSVTGRIGDNRDGDKGNETDVGPAILVHTSVPFGIQYKDESEAVVYGMILEHLNMVLPNLGAPVSHHIVNWRESQISKGLNTGEGGYEGAVMVLNMPSDAASGKRKLTENDRESIDGVVVVCGDAFTESNFEGCLRSARAAAEAIGGHYKDI